MEAAPATEKHHPRETALQRLVRKSGELAAALARVGVLAGLLAGVLLISFLTLDLPFRGFDRFFAGAEALRPSNWLTYGGLAMATAPLLAILFARRYGGEEASRAVTAAWAIAAAAVFAELSILAPALEETDLPTVRFTAAFVASAMAAQYVAVNIYDIARGGGDWWRAPMFGALGGYFVCGALYFPWVYWGAGAPWLNWMVTDFAIRLLMTAAFLPVYGALRKSLRPRGGFGG